MKISIEGGAVMWRFKYLVCLISKHVWIGSLKRYCLRCGKLEMQHSLDA